MDIDLSGQTRNDLKCAEVNTNNLTCSKFKTQLCACSATAKWMLDGSKIGFLRLEYLSRKGVSRILRTESTKDVEFDLYHLHVPNSFLSLIPNNLCEYPTLVMLNLANNRLMKLNNLGCISRLTKIDFSYNRITEIKKSNFAGLFHLNDLDVSFNKISYIEPGTFNDLGLINLNVSYNQITILDITHLLLSKTFCKISFANNRIYDFSNGGDNPVKASDTVGDGGIVDLSWNRIQRIPNPARLGLGKGYDVYGKISFNRFIFILWDNPIACDCFLEEYLRNAKNALDHYKVSNNLGYVCHSPLRLRGMSVVEGVLHTSNFSILTCNLPHSCPHHCSCYFDSSRDSIVVECSKSYNQSRLPSFNLTELTKGLKDHTRYENATINLRFSVGNIRVLDNHDYLINTSFIDLSSNKVEYLEERAMQNLTSSLAKKLTLNLTSNFGVLHIPSRLRYLNPQNVYLNNATLYCDCKLMSWFPNWLDSMGVEKAGLNITCNIGQSTMTFENVTISDLDCEEVDDYFLAYTLGILLVIILKVYYLLNRYGLYGFVYYKSKIQNKRKTLERFKYDVYISCEETNETMFRYVIREFIPMLKAFHLKPFLLAQDSEFGEVLEESIIHNLDASRIYVFFLSSTVLFVGEDNSTFWKEWKHAWNKYAFSTVHDIVLINFDLLRLSDLRDKRMETIMAVGHHVDFSNVDFKTQILKLLDKRSGQLPHIWDQNSKSKFDLSSLNDVSLKMY
uniref:TIR domain-containing protein n=1 Tax=Magallana gigas TaxID=29159 RepID=A0A8W8K311_MAGGI